MSFEFRSLGSNPAPLCNSCIMSLLFHLSLGCLNYRMEDKSEQGHEN